MEDTRNPAQVTYLARHSSGRTRLGDKKFPWVRIDGHDLAVGLDTNDPADIVLMINGDHDGVHIALTRQQIVRLAEKFDEALQRTDADVDPTPVEQWQVTEGVSAAERYERELATVAGIESGRVA